MLLCQSNCNCKKKVLVATHNFYRLGFVVIKLIAIEARRMNSLGQLQESSTVLAFRCQMES